MKPLRVGIIGCGWIAQTVHVPAYIENPKSRLVAICDANKERLAEFARKYQVQNTFSDYQELLQSSSVDAVSICTPSALHSKVAVASKDPVAADATGAKIIGINPARVGYLKLAKKKGIGAWEKIELVGSSIEEVATPFAFIPTRYYHLGRISLALQRYSRYAKNLAEVIRLSVSGLSTVGHSAIKKRISYSGMWRLAKNAVFTLDE